MGRQIGRYDRELRKVVWVDEEDFRPTHAHDSAAIWAPIEFRAVGLPGAPVVTSRNEYRKLLKQHGLIEMGNEAPKIVRETHERRRT